MEGKGIVTKELLPVVFTTLGPHHCLINIYNLSKISELQLLLYKCDPLWLFRSELAGIGT